MSRIQTARYEQFLRRLLRIVDGDVLPELQGDISPVIQMENPSDPALLFWKGHNLAQGQVVSAAQAALNSVVFLENPPGSSKIIDVLDIHVLGANIVGMQVEPGAVGGSVGVKQFIDSRHNPLISEPTGILNTSGSAAVLGNFFEQASPNPRHIDIPFVLVPNTFLRITQDAINVLFEVSMVWLERTAEDSELQV